MSLCFLYPCIDNYISDTLYLYLRINTYIKDTLYLYPCINTYISDTNSVFVYPLLVIANNATPS